MSKYCKWIRFTSWFERDCYYETCKEPFYFCEEQSKDSADSEFKFCPYCGKEIKEEEEP